MSVQVNQNFLSPLKRPSHRGWIEKPLSDFKNQDPPRHWHWHDADVAYFQRALAKLEGIKRSKKECPRIWQRAYGLSWNLLGHSFEIAAHGLLLRERLREIRQVHPQAHFFPGHVLGFSEKKDDEAVPDGLTATLDFKARSLSIHELYEFKAKARPSLDEIEKQIESTRRNILLRNIIFLKLHERSIALRTEFSGYAPYSVRQAAIVLPDFAAVTQAEHRGIPIFSVPFDRVRVRELLVELIWSHLDFHPNGGGDRALISA